VIFWFQSSTQRFPITPQFYVVKLKLKLIYDLQSVGQSVLVSGTHLGPDKFFFLLEIFFRLLRVCYFVAPSLIYCTIVSGPCQSSHSWVEVPQNSRPYFTVSSETPPTCRARSPYLYPPGSLFAASYDSQGYDGGILTRLHTGLYVLIFKVQQPIIFSSVFVLALLQFLPNVARQEYPLLMNISLFLFM
jgi:hypothetical protein